MACRRCVSSKVVESDDFYKLPADAQALYFHMNMIADDDGFVNNASSTYSRIKNGASALANLVEKRFVLKFGTVYVIKHWRISNSLKSDRVKPLLYAEISKKVWIKENRAYTDHFCNGCITLYEARTGLKPEPERNPNGIQMESGWNPNGILTQPNLTKPNQTKPNQSREGSFAGLFEQVWDAYPEDRRGNKESAYQAHRQVVPDEDTNSMVLSSLQEWKQSEQWNKDGGKYIPYLCNWLLRLTWKTKPERMTIPNGASGELGEAEMAAIRRVLAMEDDGMEVAYGDGLV